MSLEILTDIAQTIVVGLLIGVVVYFQFRRPRHGRVPVATVAGLGGALVYGALKVVF